MVLTRSRRNSLNSERSESQTMEGNDVMSQPEPPTTVPAVATLPANSIVMSDQQFAQILQMLRAPSVSPTNVNPTISNNFAKCTARFNGEKDTDVTAFIDAIQIYKECLCIDDDIALRGLPMLFTGFAATWWQGVKHSVDTWGEAIVLLGKTYGPHLPPHRIYRELFKTEQGKEATDVFVCKCRALLAQLPPNTLSEPTQLDMVYGLLNKRIREKVTRISICSFSDLLDQARRVEDMLDESYTATAARPPGPEQNQDQNTIPSAKVKCGYCKKLGHDKSNCERLVKKNDCLQNDKIVVSKDNTKPTSSENNSNKIICYGCGSPGFVKSNCPNCNNLSGFCSMDTIQYLGTNRPILNIMINGVTGTALIDTAAKCSIASTSLYSVLKRDNRNCYDNVTMSMKLADGQVNTVNTLVTKVEVVLQGRSIINSFVILPGDNDNVTLLGMDFIKSAGLVIDFGSNQWMFSDQPNVRYDMCYESVVSPVMSCSSSDMLRADEGTLLSTTEKDSLEEVLQSFTEVFTIGGEPTPFAQHHIDTGNNKPIFCEENSSVCGVCNVTVDMPRWTPVELRSAQLEDPDVKKIIDDFESSDSFASVRWTDRSYYMTQGVLYHFNPDSESEEPQLVVPLSMRAELMKEHHDKAIAGHHGVDRTYRRMSQNFYFPGMRKYISDYVRTCLECQRYKPENTKPAGLLQTPVPSQRFEVLAVDLFGPLPTGDSGERWVLVVEDVASRWVELFPMISATAEATARLLIEEVFLRYGFPRRIISDNGVQFVAETMQQVMHVFGIKQDLIPLYHPQANPVERKNRDLKSQLGPIIESRHNQWPKALPSIRYAMNSAVTQTTECTPAYLTFGRELRSPMAATCDLRAVIESDNYLPQMTPYLKKLASDLYEVKEVFFTSQDRRKDYADKFRRSGPNYSVGDLVLLKSHVLSSRDKGVSSKLAPRRDGPYKIIKEIGPTTFLLAYAQDEANIIGKYHCQDISHYHARDDDVVVPLNPKRKRGRPPKLQREDGHTQA